MTKAIPFELEGMVSTVTVVRLLTDDLGAIGKALANKVEQMPGFFQDAPIALDLSALEGRDDDENPPANPRQVPLAPLAALLRELKLVPVGVRHLREARRQEARAAGLGVLRGSGRKAPTPKPEVSPAPQPPVAAQQAASSADDRRSGNDRRNKEDGYGSLLLRAPLRSGQVVYAEQSDAVVLAPINAGA